MLKMLLYVYMFGARHDTAMTDLWEKVHMICGRVVTPCTYTCIVPHESMYNILETILLF